MERFAPLFAFTDGDRWRLGIGDPSLMGWLTVGAYLAAAFLCWRASGKATSKKETLFWMGLAALLALLGVNKQLDLQTAFTFMAKDFAKATGWYENRRVVQAVFIVLIGLGGVGATGGLLWFFRKELNRLWPALVGFAFLAGFVVIRAASFHHVDQVLNFAPAGFRINWLLELGGIAAIALPAWRAGRGSRLNHAHAKVFSRVG